MLKLISIAILINFLSSCKPTPVEIENATLNPSATLLGIQNCSQEIFNLSDEQVTPTNIVELIEMINLLPKPLNLPCFIKTLKRPLFINLTNSKLSAQPALGDDDPRVFIMRDRLILSMVTSGNASHLLEFSELMPGNNKVSIKGEIDFPILEELNFNDPFQRIEQNSMTTCSACHVGEQRYYHEQYTAFTSAAVKPITPSLLNINVLQTQTYLCDLENSNSTRCSMIRALTDHGRLNYQSFPSDMPTLTESFRN